MGEDITAALSAPLATLSLVPVDATVVTAGSRRILRVLLDRDVSGLAPDDATSPVPPLSLDEIAEASRVVGETLDGSGVMGERPYTLEVSSPGVGRPLEGYAPLRRNVGRLVSLSLTDHDGAPPHEISGRLVSVDPQEVVVEVASRRGAPGRRHTVPLGDVRSARVQVEFSRPGDAPSGRDPAREVE